MFLCFTAFNDMQTAWQTFNGCIYIFASVDCAQYYGDIFISLFLLPSSVAAFRSFMLSNWFKTDTLTEVNVAARDRRAIRWHFCFVGILAVDF